MATLNDAVRRINQAIVDYQTEMVSGYWFDEDSSPEKNGTNALRALAHLQGLKQALDLISELQRDN